ncbi:MAG: DNA polymerase III subunit gamma/tau [Planctomycetaceae bacterium]|nr:DNA polymerase III subunit gamma/tau [Planctomycetaceae bacterium]
MAYLVLARKYRSNTFDEVVGQEHIAQTLKNAIAAGRIAHAYLFTGTRGVGKTTMARILAKALNCLATDEPTQTPCGTCDACAAIARGDDIDVIEIDGASNRGIDEIRELRANAAFRPSRSRYRIYYIDEVHALTKDAFNALLKTLEEPPAHVKFVFATTEPEKIPATILSRCQRFDFRNIATARICDHLKALCKAENVPADDDALYRIARSAAGSMRDGLSLLDQMLSGTDRVTDAEVVRVLGTAGDERMIALAAAIAAGNAADALGELSGALEMGVTLSSVVQSLCETFRNMMLARTCGPASELIELPESQRKTVGDLAAKFSLPSLVYAVSVLQATGRNVRGSSVGRALVEAAIVRLAQADQFVDPASLIERLENPASRGTGSVNRPVQQRPAVGATAPDTAEQKKNSPLTTDAPVRTPPSAPSAPSAAIPPHEASPDLDAAAPSPATNIVWQASWLAENWKTVVETLFRSKRMQEAGLLGPGAVQSLEGQSLTLLYEADHEHVRRRCEAQSDRLDAALSELAGTPVHCKFLPAGGAEQAAGPVAPAMGGFSTDQRAAIAKDPAIRKIAALFDAEVADVRREGAGNGTVAAASDDVDATEPIQ